LTVHAFDLSFRIRQPADEESGFEFSSHESRVTDHKLQFFSPQRTQTLCPTLAYRQPGVEERTERIFYVVKYQAAWVRFLPFLSPEASCCLAFLVFRSTNQVFPKY